MTSLRAGRRLQLLVHIKLLQGPRAWLLLLLLRLPPPLLLPIIVLLLLLLSLLRLHRPSTLLLLVSVLRLPWILVLCTLPMHAHGMQV
jgi:hypothetical protein